MLRCAALRLSGFPLGDPCGHPWDKDMQTATVRLALQVLETATRPRTTVRSPFAWKAEDPEWRERYNRLRAQNQDKLLAIGGARHRRLGQIARGQWLVAVGVGRQQQKATSRSK